MEPFREEVKPKHSSLPTITAIIWLVFASVVGLVAVWRNLPGN